MHIFTSYSEVGRCYGQNLTKRQLLCSVGVAMFNGSVSVYVAESSYIDHLYQVLVESVITESSKCFAVYSVGLECL